MDTHVCWGMLGVLGMGLGRETLAKPVPDRSTRACALRIIIPGVDLSPYAGLRGRALRVPFRRSLGLAPAFATSRLRASMPSDDAYR